MRLLVLTDHSGHTDANSLYALLRAMMADVRVSEIRVASRGTPANAAFFACELPQNPAVGELRRDELAHQTLATLSFHGEMTRNSAAEYFSVTKPGLIDTPLAWADLVFLRVPHPVPENWFSYLPACFGDKPIINRPAGIAITTSKAWLTTVAAWCAPMQLCATAQEVVNWVQPTKGGSYRDTVLKPLTGYGGQGILRILRGQVQTSAGNVSLAAWPAHPLAQQAYLAVQYLPGVRDGDKRIVVIDGRVIGSVLRVPAAGKWLCNVSQGGHAEPASITAAEALIIAALDPLLRRIGVVMYGVDTLVGLDGTRVLSEVNTMSIGGLLDLPNLTGRTAVQFAAQCLVDVFASQLRAPLTTPTA